MTTWVLIADGARAFLHVQERPGLPLKQVDDWESKAGMRQSREIGSDRPGRSYSSAGSGQSAMEPSTDPQRHAKAEFAGHLASVLKQREQDYQQLVLVAAPKTLGDLRQALDKQVLKKVSGELDKDLTHTPANELPAHLGELLNLPDAA